MRSGVTGDFKKLQMPIKKSPHSKHKSPIFQFKFHSNGIFLIAKYAPIENHTKAQEIRGTDSNKPQNTNTQIMYKEGLLNKKKAINGDKQTINIKSRTYHKWKAAGVQKTYFTKEKYSPV